LAQVEQPIAAGGEINDRDVITRETFLTEAAYDDYGMP